VNIISTALWQDNRKVIFLTSIYDVRQQVLRNHKKPKESGSNTVAARKPFGASEYQKL